MTLKELRAYNSHFIFCCYKLDLHNTERVVFTFCSQNRILPWVLALRPFVFDDHMIVLWTEEDIFLIYFINCMIIINILC